MSDHELTHDEIWDDSDLVTAWDEALQEYQVEHNKPFRLADVMEAHTNTTIPSEADTNLSDQTDMVETETTTHDDETLAMNVTDTLHPMEGSEAEKSSKREGYIRAFESMKTQQQKYSSAEDSRSQEAGKSKKVPVTKGTGSSKTTGKKRSSSTMDSDHETDNPPSVNDDGTAHPYPYYPPSDYYSYYGYYPSPWYPPTWDSTDVANTYYTPEQPLTTPSSAWWYGARPPPPPPPPFANHHPSVASNTPSPRRPPTRGPRPPPPPTMAHEPIESQMDDSALANLLLSWYTAGYYTGLYQNRTRES
ncbi:hypothetical protein IWQ62_005320 [Dispira parvispora]|uniref:Survival Motor Neuron Gemin2-binding domain-containing protein n=1 Tax=Dispira parvispora TaxID=1520584 RepID=A0A9W8AQ59_9FUNG|nr:hypothetical protein IWQ62_005320 [Dispira parvispora]